MNWVSWFGLGWCLFLVVDFTCLFIARRYYGERWMFAWPMCGLYCMWRVWRARRQARR